MDLKRGTRLANAALVIRHVTPSHDTDPARGKIRSRSVGATSDDIGATEGTEARSHAQRNTNRSRHRFCTVLQDLFLCPLSHPDLPRSPHCSPAASKILPFHWPCPSALPVPFILCPMFSCLCSFIPCSLLMFPSLSFILSFFMICFVWLSILLSIFQFREGRTGG